MKREHTILSFIFLFVLALLPLIALFHPGLPQTHDGQDHVARIANFYLSLSEGHLVPRWAANLNWGYGHPILMFLYPLPSYMASLFRAVGFGFVNSTKLVFGVSFILSVLTMYLWAREEFGKLPGLTAAVLYGFAPYRFVDLYVRGAIGEHVIFIFPPLIMYFLKRLSRHPEEVRNTVYGALVTAGLILSHNALSLMFLPVIALYVVYLYVYDAHEKRRFVLSAFAGGILGFSLSAFFWIPAFFEGKYTLRDIVTADGMTSRFVSPLWFLYSPWNYGGGNEFTKALGYAQWVGIAGAAYILFRAKQELRVLIAGSLCILAGTLFLMVSPSNFVWNSVTLLQKFQFPWRFLSLAVFASALAGGAAVAGLEARVRKKTRDHMPAVIAGMICGLAILGTAGMWHPKAYLSKPESFYTGVYKSTTDTGESSPIWSVRFMEHTPKAPMQAVNGTAEITPVVRTTTDHEYRIKAQTEVRILENTLYFPGWNVYVDGVKTDIQFQDPEYRGLMTFRVPAGEHTVRVAFSDTRIRQAAGLISLISLGFVGIVYTGSFVWRKRA